MKNLSTISRPNTQKRYRKNQANKGLVRFEIQVSKNTKDQFDKIVQEVASEFIEPWDQRRRIAKARARIFDEMTNDVRHEFFNLKDQIAALRSEIKALSPAFFTSDDDIKTPLPEAISALPDDPAQLKHILAKTYRDSQKAKVDCAKYKRQADQFSKLYEAIDDYNDELVSLLKEHDIPLPKG